MSSLFRAGLLTCAIAPAACSGGGGTSIPAGPASASPTSTPTATGHAGPGPSASPATTPSASGSPSAVSAGAVYYHFDPPVTSTSGLLESLQLAGDRYTALAMSNYVAGAMLGHTIATTFPGVQFDKDYLYGTMFGQLLQENIETSLYTAGSSVIDPSPLQAAVMGVGQGGPFQINNYDVDLAYGGYAAQGYALLNYVAVQRNLGFTMAQAPMQFSLPTPASFDDVSYGPMLTAYFHLNDMRALAELGTTTYSPAPAFSACLSALRGVPNAPLDVIVNYAYNQGYYGGLVASSTSACASNVSAFVASTNGYASAAGDSYHAYPYQVRFYLDELYNRSTIVPATSNHLSFLMSSLGTVFDGALATLSTTNAGGVYAPVPVAAAQGAFAAALAKNGISATARLDISDAGQRAKIFAVLDDAIAGTEAATGGNFSATTSKQL